MCFCAFVFLLHWIAKRTSRSGRLLENLEYSDSKIMMKGTIVCQPDVWGKNPKYLDEFHLHHTAIFFTPQCFF